MNLKHFKIGYFYVSAILLFIEVCIAVFVKDSFVRPFVGDYLAVIFVYYLLATFIDLSTHKLATITILIAFTIEGLQLFEFLKRMNWEHHRMLRIILGSSFDWGDMLAYTLGVLTVLFIHKSPNHEEAFC